MSSKSGNMNEREEKRRRMQEPNPPQSFPPEEEEEEEEGGGETESEEEDDMDVSRLYMDNITQLRQLLKCIHGVVPQKYGNEFAQIRDQGAQMERFLEKKKVCLFGTNGAGKSFLINLWLMLTSYQPSEYRDANMTAPGQKSEKKHEAMEIESPSDEQIKVVEFKNDMSWRPNDINDIIHGFTRLLDTVKSEGGKKPPVYLLPSRNKGYSLTPCTITMVFRERFEMIVEYLSKDELLEDVEPWIACQRGGETARRGHKLHDMRVRYNKVVKDQYKTSKDGKIPDHIQGKEDVEIRAELEERAGQRHVYSGAGKDLHNDRQYIRDTLAELLAQPDIRVCVKSVQIGVPSRILQDVVHIADCPGDL